MTVSGLKVPEKAAAVVFFLPILNLVSWYATNQESERRVEPDVEKHVAGGKGLLAHCLYCDSARFRAAQQRTFLPPCCFCSILESGRLFLGFLFGTLRADVTLASCYSLQLTHWGQSSTATRPLRAMGPANPHQLCAMVEYLWYFLLYNCTVFSACMFWDSTIIHMWVNVGSLALPLLWQGLSEVD